MATTLMGSEGSSALFQRSYRSSMDRASTQLEGFEERHVVLEEDVHKLFGPAVSVTPEYIAAYRPSEELGGVDEVAGGVWDVPKPIGHGENENAAISPHPATHQASLGSQCAGKLDGQLSYQEETYDDDAYDETLDGSDDAGTGDRQAGASKKADAQTEAAAPRTTLQWLYQLGRQLSGADTSKQEQEPQPSNNNGFQPKRPRPPPKKKQVSITQSMRFHNTST